MMKMTEQELKKTVAANIVYYRTQAGMTQLQLAEYLNYSDKSVSKWENADGLPDVYVLHRIAELFKIDIADLTSVTKKKKAIGLVRMRTLLLALCSFLCILIAATVFGFGYFFSNAWQFVLAFVYVVPVIGIVMLVFATIWKYRILGGVSTSLVIWGSVLVIAMTILVFAGDQSSLWVFVIIALPLQALTIIWYFFRDLLYKAKDAISKIRHNKDETDEPDDK